MEVYFQRLPLSVFGKLVTTLVLSWQLMSDGGRSAILLGWAAISVCHCLALLLFNWRRIELIAKRGIAWVYRVAVASAVLSGIVWGTVAGLVMFYGSPLDLACLVFCMAGMMTGGNFAYATLWSANFCYLCGISLGLGVGALYRGPDFSVLFLGALGAYSFIIWKFYRLAIDDFFQRLVSERNKLEDTARTLSILLYEYDTANSDLLWEVDANGCVTSVANVSRRIVEFDGIDKDRIVGSRLADLFVDSDEKTSLVQHIAQGTPFRDLTLKLRGGNSPIWWRLRAGPIGDLGDANKRVRGVATDVTSAKLEEERMARMALYDSLTNVPNRAMFNETLERSLRNGVVGRLTVMYLDFDNFKMVNDTLGHDVGDKLLEQVARRLENCIKPSDMVARLGGDEFTILLTDISSLSVVEDIAGRIVTKLSQPFSIGSHQIRSSVSIGIAMWLDDSATAEELMKRADSALYAAKERGRNQFCFYDATMIGFPEQHQMRLNNVTNGVPR